MIVNKYNNGGGSSSGGSADYATLAGEANKSKLLEGSSALPQSGNTGDVVAVAPAPALLSTRGTKGLRSANNTAIGIYQYDGSDWNKIEGGEGSSAYKIELLEVNPELYTQADRATLSAFCAAFDEDNSIADSAYIYAVDGIYRCVRYTAIQGGLSTFTFEGTHNNNIVDIWLHFASNTYIYGNIQNAVPTPDFTTLKSLSELPADGETGDVVAVSTPAQEGTWEMFDASEHPTKVRILTKGDGTYLLHFNNDNLYTGLDYTAGDPPSFDGSGWRLTQDDTYEWHFDEDGYYIKVWAEEEDGGWYIYADMTQGEGGFSTLDAYQLGSTTDMYVGGTDGSVGVYQYDGSAWNRIDKSAYKIELSITTPDDFTQDDIDNLNAFFAAVKEDPSIADSAYIYCSDDGSIYRCTYVYYDSENSGGQFEFVYPTAYAIAQITIEFESGEYSEATNNFLENNVLTIGDLPKNPYVGMIANYIDGQGNIGLYRYDGSGWQPYGGGSDFVHLDSLSGTGETGKTYEFNQRLYKWVNGAGKWGRFIKARPNGTDYAQNTEVKSYLLYSILPPVTGETILVHFKCLNTNFYLSYDPSSTFKVYDNNSMTGTPVDIQYNGSEVGFTGNNRTMYISWVEGKVIFRQPDAWVKIEDIYADFEISTPHWEAYDVDEFNSVSDIEADLGLPMWNSDGRIVGKSYNLTRYSIKFNNTGYTNTKYVYGEGWQNFGSWFFPTQAGTAGQVLTSAGNAEPTWETMIKAVKITSAAYDALVQAGTTDPNTLYLIDDSNA